MRQPYVDDAASDEGTRSLMSPVEVARLLHVDASTVRRMVRAGEVDEVAERVRCHLCL
jgi:hypothetical protein